MSGAPLGHLARAAGEAFQQAAADLRQARPQLGLGALTTAARRRVLDEAAASHERAGALGALYEALLDCELATSRGEPPSAVRGAARHTAGAFYTPEDLVRHAVSETLGPLLEGRSPGEAAELRIVDPACGAGAFLLGAQRFLLDWYAARSPVPLTAEDRLRITARSLFGVDVDPLAAHAARLVLALGALDDRADEGALRAAVERLSESVQAGDALLDVDSGHTSAFDWRRCFAGVFERPRGGFDAVLGNPPYIDAETMARHHVELRRYASRRYRTASGNWDLFCVFIERALELLRPGGRHAFVVPNKLASAAYASAARRELGARGQVVSIWDHAEAGRFDASVYPIVYVFEAHGDAPGPGRRTRVVRGAGAPASFEVSLPADGSPWPVFTSGEAPGLLQRLAHLPRLSDLAELSGAATVAEAYTLAPLLTSQASPEPGDLRVVNSGTIDPFRALWEERPLRYLGRSIPCPVLPRGRRGLLPPRRLTQTERPKVIVATMTQRLEAVADEAGELLAAKSTVLVFPAPGVSVACVAALLNSRLLTQLFREAFGGNTLRGGYLRVGPKELGALPFPELREPQARALAEEAEALGRRAARCTSEELGELLEALEQAARALFGLGGEPPQAG